MFADFVPGTGGVGALGRGLDRARCGDAAQRARPLSVRLLGADHQPRAAAALCQRARRRGASRARRRRRPAHPRRHRAAAGAAGLERLVRPVVGRRRRRLARLLRHRLPDARARARLRRCRRRRSSSRSTGCATYVANAPDPSKDGGRDLAYALYVLARNGAAPVGDLRYIADTKLDDCRDADRQGADRRGARPCSATRRAPSASIARRSTRIAPQPKLEFGRADYGSALRDAAALVTLASEGGAPQRDHRRRGRARRGRARAHRPHLDPGGRLAGAGRARARQAGQRHVARCRRRDAAGRALSQPARRRTATAPLTVTNTGDGTVQAVVSVSRRAAHAGARGRDAASRSSAATTRSTASRPIRRKAKQNQRFAVVLKITEPQPQFGRVIVADYLPAGFEIDNPHLVSSGDTGTLAWIDGRRRAGEYANSATTASPPPSTASEDSPPVFTVAYVVRAVSPGHYVLPQADGGGHVPARPFRPHRHRHDRDHGGEMKRWRHHRLAVSSRGAAVAGRARRRRPGSIRSGPPPLGRRTCSNISHLVLDRDGQAAARLRDAREGRWRLPATREGRRSALPQTAVRL